MDAKTICSLHEKMKVTRSLWDQLWQDVADYIVFRKASINGQKSDGEKLTSNLFDSTATIASQDLAAWIHGQLTEMSMEWFSLKPPPGYDNDKAVREWLADCQTRQYQALRDSNFSGAWLELLNDLSAFCTGALYFEELPVEQPGFNGLNFIPLPPGSYCIFNDRDGRTNGLFREMKLSAQEAVKQYGEGSLSEKVKKDLDKDPNSQHDFLHAVVPSGYFGGKKGRWEFESYHVEVGNKTVVKESGFRVFPFIVIPWMRESGETYGRGPGITALPDVKTLSKAKELGLKEWALSILPPLGMVDQGVIGRPKLTPAGLTIVRNKDSIFPIFTGSNHQADRMKLEDIRAQIEKVFYRDKIQYIPPRNETGEMTAYEVARRYEMAQNLLGPTYGNIVYHGLDRLIEGVFNVMAAADAFLPAPGALGGARIEYESPLARARRNNEVKGIVETIETVGNIAMQYERPDLLDNLKLDESIQEIGKIKGFPAKLMASEREVKAIREVRAKAQQQQQALDSAEQAATAAGKLGRVPPKLLNMAMGGAQ